MNIQGASPLIQAGLWAVAVVVPVVIASELKAAVLLLALPVATAGLLALWRWPIFGLHLALAAGFCAPGLKRYLRIPAGLSIDFLLALLIAIVFVQNLRVRDWSRMTGLPSLMVAIWIFYNLLELLNPQPISLMAWFYAGRGVAMYLVLFHIACHLLRTWRQVAALVVHWAAWAMAAALWGIKQAHAGVTATEASWLAAGAHQTHILHGKLRAFSFLSDAGQFGVVMAYSALFFGLLMLAPLRLRWRLLFGGVSALCFYGMMVSGTRSAVAAVPVGGLCFAFISRNWRLAMPCVVLIVLFVGVLKFTNVGQGIYSVQRMRQAFNPLEDPSFQVRLQNQRRLIPYLKAHPMGGGVGSAGYWGQRFTPGTFLADLALDSYYVKIAAEQGPVGFILFMGMMLVVAGAGFTNQPKLVDPIARVGFCGIWGVIQGVLVASYSNQYLGQIPTGVIVYVGMAVLVVGPRLEGALLVTDQEGSSAGTQRD